MSASNLKISIAALSLCVSAVAAYIYFPYVIAAVSGSGAIEAVPLAIFAVSAIVALVSVICLIRLAVSRAGDKKKIDLSGEQQTGSKQSTTEEPVHEDNTNLKDELIRKKIDSKDIGLQTEVGGLEHVNINQPTPQPQDLVAVKKDIGSQTEVGGLEHVNINQPTPQPQDLVAVKKDIGSQTEVGGLEHVNINQPTPLQPQPILSIAIPQNNNASSPSPSVTPPPPPPPLPPGGLKNWNPQKNNTTGEKSSVGTTQENTPPRKKYKLPKDTRQVSVSNDTIINARANLKKSVQPNNSIGGQQGGGGSMDDSRKVPQNRQDPVKELDAVQSNKGTDKKEAQNERKKQDKQGSTVSSELTKKLKDIRKSIVGGGYSDDEHDSSANSPIVYSTSHNGETVSQNTDQSHREVSDSDVQEVSGPVAQVDVAGVLFDKVNSLRNQSSNLQPGGERRSESPDSGHGSGSERTSPSHSVPKAGELPVPQPSSPTKVDSVEPVNSEVQGPFTLPFKDRCGMFGEKANKYQLQSVVDRGKRSSTLGLK